MGETREVGNPAQREQTREQSVPKNEVRRMGENFDWKETLPLKLSSEHTPIPDEVCAGLPEQLICSRTASRDLSLAAKKDASNRFFGGVLNLFDFLSLLEYKRLLRL